MSKKLIIFGNGLGMALDPEHFSLTNAMQRVWACEKRLTPEEKTIIGALKGISAKDGPTSEDDLVSTQRALGFLSDFRQSLGKEALETWFTQEALGYPEALRKYVFEVSRELFEYEIPKAREARWHTFLSYFITFVRDTRSHVSTLNYDDLLYEPIVSGFNVNNEVTIKLSKSDNESNNPAPYLRDGFMNRSFSPQTFDWAGDCGHYLHLHGSPLLATQNDSHVKLNRNGFRFTSETQKRHIVLANRNDKEAIIDRSEVLKDYWENRLPKCIKDAQEIILLGYSGEDKHLNELIRENKKIDDDTTRRIVVVEWNGATHSGVDNQDDVLETQLTQSEYWEKQVCSDKLIQLDNILDFVEWDDPEGANQEDEGIPF
jgi:hypothetical protein